MPHSTKVNESPPSHYSMPTSNSIQSYAHDLKTEAIKAFPTGDQTIEPYHPVDAPPTKRDKIRAFAHDIKSKTHEVFNSDHVEDKREVDLRTRDEIVLDELKDSAAFNPVMFLERPDAEAPGRTEKLAKVIKATSQVIKHPTEFIKHRATRSAAQKLAVSKPALSHNTDADLLKLFDELQDAKDARHSEDTSEEASRKRDLITERKDKIEDMQKQRFALEVAWQTDRHVQRVKVVRREPGIAPTISDFEVLDDCGEKTIEWGRYLVAQLIHYSYPFTAEYIDDFKDDELPFDVNVLRRHIERFILVSAPLQVWLSNVRHVYRWEHPWRTAKWAAIYMVLLYSRNMITFVWGYFCYRTIMNYYRREDMNELKESLERTLNRETTAFKIGEVIDQYGNKEWLGPFMNQVGPYIQLQLSDLTDLLEVMYGFYHWRDPQKTKRTLILFSTMFFIGLLTSVDFCLQVFYFIIGVIFFLSWPVSSLHPRYRMAVSPLRLLFYNVPTHAEWCFQYLQQRSVAVLSALENKTQGAIYTGTEGLGTVIADTEGLHMTTADVPVQQSAPPQQQLLKKRPVDILKFTCMHAHTPGHLIISSIGIRFRSTLPLGHTIDPNPTTDFFVSFPQIEEMRKCDPVHWTLKSAGAFTSRLQKLEIKIRQPEDLIKEAKGLVDGSETMTTIMLEGFKERDKAFNAIIGFSGSKFMNLQDWSIQ